MAKVPLPRRIQSANREINDVQSVIGDTLRAVVAYEPLTGVHIQSVSVPSTGVAVSHGLGRVPIGWQVTDLLDHGTVKRTAWDSKTITLASNSGTVRVDLMVW